MVGPAPPQPIERARVEPPLLLYEARNVVVIRWPHTDVILPPYEPAAGRVRASLG